MRNNTDKPRPRDGGVSSLGVYAMLVGRLFYWKLAWDGAEGVRLMLEILRREVDLVLGHCRHTSVHTLSPSVVDAPCR